jgi:hypothetical protein
MLRLAMIVSPVIVKVFPIDESVWAEKEVRPAALLRDKDPPICSMLSSLMSPAQLEATTISPVMVEQLLRASASP